MSRITIAQLESIVGRINSLTNSPPTPYERAAEGRTKARIGNYHLDGAYGGYALYRMVSEGGAIKDVLQIGHAPKRELYHAMFAFIAGLESAQKAGA